jgi:hypothetical protein
MGPRAVATPGGEGTRSASPASGLSARTGAVVSPDEPGPAAAGRGADGGGTLGRGTVTIGSPRVVTAGRRAEPGVRVSTLADGRGSLVPGAVRSLAAWAGGCGRVCGDTGRPAGGDATVIFAGAAGGDATVLSAGGGRDTAVFLGAATGEGATTAGFDRPAAPGDSPAGFGGPAAGGFDVAAGGGALVAGGGGGACVRGGTAGDRGPVAGFPAAGPRPSILGTGGTLTAGDGVWARASCDCGGGPAGPADLVLPYQKYARPTAAAARTAAATYAAIT